MLKIESESKASGGPVEPLPAPSGRKEKAVGWCSEARKPLSIGVPSVAATRLRSLCLCLSPAALEIFPQMKGDHQVELVERGWLELAVENLMAKNDALNRRVEELSRHALGDQEATLLAEEAAARLHKENCELKLQRDMLQHRVRPVSPLCLGGRRLHVHTHAALACVD
jgi:hypothetical protein